MCQQLDLSFHVFVRTRFPGSKVNRDSEDIAFTGSANISCDSAPQEQRIQEVDLHVKGEDFLLWSVMHGGTGSARASGWNEVQYSTYTVRKCTGSNHRDLQQVELRAKCGL